MAKTITNDDRLLKDITSPAVCSFCKNLNPGTRTCLAFTELIPTSIWSGKNTHTSHVSGDLDITFEQATSDELRERAKGLNA